MSDEVQQNPPEHLFFKVIWRTTLQTSATLETFSTWTITGVAGIAALLISNLDSIASIASLTGIKLTIMLFAFSLLTGAISKQFGMAVATGLHTLRETENLLYSESGQALMEKMTIEPRNLVSELSKPFLWPISLMMRRGGEKGISDALAQDKKFVRLFCFQLLFSALHELSAIVALVVIALSIP